MAKNILGNEINIDKPKPPNDGTCPECSCNNIDYNLLGKWFCKECSWKQ